MQLLDALHLQRPATLSDKRLHRRVITSTKVHSCGASRLITCVFEVSHSNLFGLHQPPLQSECLFQLPCAMSTRQLLAVCRLSCCKMSFLGYRRKHIPLLLASWPLPAWCQSCSCPRKDSMDANVTATTHVFGSCGRILDTPNPYNHQPAGTTTAAGCAILFSSQR